jgi:hypothetical protein
MDDVLKLPAVYGPDGRYDQFDFILYDELQEFNRHHDIFKLYAAFRRLYPGGLEKLLDSCSSLNNWVRNELRSDGCQIVNFFGTAEHAIDQASESPADKAGEDFKNVTYWVLDRIEGYGRDTTAREKLTHLIGARDDLSPEDVKLGISRVLFDCYCQQDRPLIDVEVLDIAVEPDAMARIFFEVRDFISGRTFALWSSISHNHALA